ncbi:hypothetical protein JCGZ_00201 [Jatropha curcas]|uniref:BZIP domain-containing protein n=1 Tax=Jatropha curcas TaxID=180498 RepID=A0A067LE86_JATCU|nr:hypothetical protein JCGZ_00201 [Jatropha curcas]
MHRQFAQRSRVRKLQYIAELERNVQALQAEAIAELTNSRDLDSQFANLSLKQKDANPGRDPVTGPLRT